MNIFGTWNLQCIQDLQFYMIVSLHFIVSLKFHLETKKSETLQINIHILCVLFAPDICKGSEKLKSCDMFEYSFVFFCWALCLDFPCKNIIGHLACTVDSQAVVAKGVVNGLAHSPERLVTRSSK